ncbi:DUF7547 family protein [Halogranum rubrum]|uniref:Uncharacterized protein n=1 Tax=Halogranum salarium B-1 TaxID=1210908 RepID=J3JGN4_9EURY|nr:hypothetical protein [Halogranum salarium]EJN60246.1 hypothetical protein HSB1_08490 [Halogranum salarium B-1]
MSSRRDDDDFVDLLDDLELTLGDLRDELERRPEARRRFRPPTPSEILRFTDEYTIPTVVSILEANIRALELLQKLLRLANPEGSLREGSEETRRRVSGVRDEAVDGLDRALSELQRALTEADLPDDPESRDIIEDARGLTDEIERRIESSRSGSHSRRDSRGRRRTDGRSRSSREHGHSGRTEPVEISVEEEPDGGRELDEMDEENERNNSDGFGDDGDGFDDAEVDVESELQSIKDELDDVDDEGDKSGN